MVLNKIAVITDCNGVYINNKYQETTTLDAECYFKTHAAANNALKCLPKTINRKKYTIRLLQDMPTHHTNPEGNELTNAFDCEYVETCDIDNFVNEITTFLQQISLSRSYFVGKLARIEQEICDIEHAAEFYQLSASRGFKIYKMLRDARIRRREVKDTILKIDNICQADIGNWKSGHVLRQTLGLKERKYAPRVLDELFSDENEEVK